MDRAKAIDILNEILEEFDNCINDLENQRLPSLKKEREAIKYSLSLLRGDKKLIKGGNHIPRID